MKVLATLLTLTACASIQGASSEPARAALSVGEVIYQQRDLIGTRIVVSGRFSGCQRLSCTLHDTDENGRERFLSIGASETFDAAARRYGGRAIEIEAQLTDRCLPSLDPDIIVACADRPATLADPVFIRAL